MNTLKSKKTWIWLVIAIVILGGVYFYLSGNSTASSTDSFLSATDSNVAIGSQVLGLLNQIQSLRIDTSIFSDPGYKTLRDFSVVIPPVDVGRPNPFAPLGASNSASASAGAAASANSASH